MRMSGIEREDFEAVLSEMEKRGWILECEDGISLSRLPDRIPVYEIINISNVIGEGWDEDLNKAVTYIRNAVNEGIKTLTLGDVFDKVCGIPHRQNSDRHCTEQSVGPA